MGCFRFPAPRSVPPWNSWETINKAALKQRKSTADFAESADNTDVMHLRVIVDHLSNLIGTAKSVPFAVYNP